MPVKPWTPDLFIYYSLFSCRYIVYPRSIDNGTVLSHVRIIKSPPVIPLLGHYIFLSILDSCACIKFSLRIIEKYVFLCPCSAHRVVANFQQQQEWVQSLLFPPLITFPEVGLNLRFNVNLASLIRFGLFLI